MTALDERDPDVRVSIAIARAEYASRAVNLASADKVAAIFATMSEARAFPEVFTGPAGTRNPREVVEFAERAAAADLAVRLSESVNSIRNQDYEAATLVRRAPLVWAAFRGGDICLPNMRVVAELAATLPDNDDALFAAFDESVVTAARTLVPARFRTTARAVREKLCAQGVSERHHRAAADRRVWVESDLDGMATLCAYLPADLAHRAMAGIDATARTHVTHPDETRTLPQLRADLLGELLIGPPGARTVGVTVAVTVPVLTLLGVRDDPGTLEGYGPIDPDTARHLAGEATSFLRILTHPITGTVLDIDRTAHPVPTDMARWVRITRVQCDFPGCGRIASGCDIDHTLAWAHGGPTTITNLGLLCRDHHRVKHQTRWNPTWNQNGLTWTSPTGHIRTTDPPPWDIPASLP